MTGTIARAAEKVDRRSAAAAAPWAVVVAACLLHIELYLRNRSFWLDESMLGLNLIERSAAGLTHSLDYVQSAPVGFLLLEKGALVLFGQSEQTLRLLPLLESVLATVTFWKLVERLLARRTALVALLLFAANDVIIYQSNEAKPYSGDVLAAVTITFLAVVALEGLANGGGRAATVATALAGGAFVWISYPSVFVLAACLLAIVVAVARLADRRTTAFLGASLGLVAVSGLGAYIVASRSTTRIRGVIFVGDAQASSRFRAVAQAGWEALTDPGGFPEKLRGLALALLVIGLAAAVLRRRVTLLVLLAGPAVLAVGASLVSVYPFGGRFSLFLVPALAIFVALGLEETIAASRRPLLVGIPIVILAVAVPVGRAVGTAFQPPVRENVRPLLQLLDRDWRPGDTLYVYRNAQYAVRFYAECKECGVAPVSFPIRRATGGQQNAGFPAALASAPPHLIVGTGEPTIPRSLDDLDTLRGKRRLWLLFSHPSLAGGVLDEEDLYLSYIDRFGRRLGSWKEPGAALYLYDTTGR